MNSPEGSSSEPDSDVGSIYPYVPRKKREVHVYPLLNV